MGKVKGEEKFINELAVNRRRKKRKKELDILRRNVLEAKRKLREKTAPPKTQTSTFNKILNSFADRRQDNDNKTQGFDSKGRRTGLKKICNRLLPSRKPQVGIFANGAKGAEIKRVNLPLTELDRARFEGDLQKVLSDGKWKPKESRSDVLNKTLHRPSADTIDMETHMFIQMPAKKLEHEPVVQNFLTERQSSKRKMPEANELDRKTTKKLHSERIENTDVVVQYNKVKPGCKNLRDKKWKRSLFQDDIEDEFESMSAEPVNVDQLRFSPTTYGDKVKVNSSESKVFLDMAVERPTGTKRLNFNYGQLGRMATIKYEELCTMVCAENFETCLQEIPHIDPLEKVKQSLINFYGETCKQKSLRNKIRPEVVLAEDFSSASSQLIDKNINRNNKYFYKDAYIERSRSETVNVLPLRGGICLEKLKKFHHQEAEETSSVQSKPLITKGTELKKRKFIPCLARGPFSTETSIAGYNGSSLDVNYESSRKIFRPKIVEFLKIDEKSEPSSVELDKRSTSRLSGILSERKRTMSRCIKEVNNSETVKKYRPNCSEELSAVSADNNDMKKCYLGDPLRRHEMRTKQIRCSPERKFDEMYGLPCSEGGIEEDSQNSLDVNCDSFRTCLGLDPGKLPKIEGKARPKVVNLGNASRSTLDNIPYDRREFMLKFLQGVNNPVESIRENRATLPPEVFIVVPENNKPQKRYLDNPSRKYQIKDIPIDHPSKNERHVPAILRKSQTTKRNKKSNTAGTVLAKGILEIGNLRWKTSNFNFQKLSSTSEGTSLNSPFDNGQTLRNLPPTVSRFSIDSDNHSNPDRLELMKRISQTSQFHNRTELTETPKIVNALYDVNAKSFEVKPNFMNEIFPCEAESTTSQHNIAKSSRSVNYHGEFKLKSTINSHHQNSTDDVDLSNFNNVRQSQNLPIFMHQQRPDAKMHRGACDEINNMPSLGNQDSQRFPVFLKRKTASTSQNRKRYEEQHLDPKVIIIENQSLRGIGDEVRREINIPCIPDRIESKNTQPNGNGLTFSKFSRVMQMSPIKSVQFQHGSQKIQQYPVPDNVACQNIGQQIEQQQISRCLCKTDLQNVQHMQLPNIVCQNGMGKVVNHKYTVQELGNNPMNFFEPKTFDVPISQRMFHHNLSSHGQIPASCTSSYCGNTNFDTQLNCDSAEPVQLFDRRIGFILPKNETEPFCQSAINLPIISDQIPHRHNYSPILSEDTKRNYKYIIDPRCPQAGYQWNQIDQTGAQIHQRVIQPAYNVPDAYRPQIPHTYFSTDT